MMNELALFAGVGGGILGTCAIGIKPVYAVEIGKYQRIVLKQRQNDGMLPYFNIHDDIKTFNSNLLNCDIEIVTGGFPCQAFSTAARGRNNAENLWPEMKRIIDEIRPKYVFAENVSIEAIERAANDCADMGYKAELLSISAGDLGADHVRARFWLLAYSDDKSKLRSTVNAKMAELPEFCECVWSSRPSEPGMVNGMAGRMERYEAIGNGQVPIVAAAALWTLANA